eukprot:4691537-Pleurochrysis_carterae.AAC.8
MVDRFVREAVGIETRQPGLQEWSPRRGGRDIIPCIGNIDDISYVISGRYPPDVGYLVSYRSTSTRCTFQVRMAADCYPRGAAIAVSQLAERGTSRFAPIRILFWLIVDLTSHGALTAARPPSSPTECWLGLCPRYPTAAAQRMPNVRVRPAPERTRKRDRGRGKTQPNEGAEKVLAGWGAWNRADRKLYPVGYSLCDHQGKRTK